MPLLKSYIEFAGIHSDLFFATEGTASPNSTSALMTGRLRQVGFRAAGAAALIPSSAKKRSGSSIRSFKAIFKRGIPRTLRMIPDAENIAEDIEAAAPGIRIPGSDSSVFEEGMMGPEGRL